MVIDWGSTKTRNPRRVQVGGAFDPEGSAATAAQAALIYSQLGVSRVVLYTVCDYGQGRSAVRTVIVPLINSPYKLILPTVS